jgi:polyisoprenoid-binding protein YceI
MCRNARRWIQTLLVLVVVAAVAVGAGAATLEVVPAASEARYLVREQLAGLSFPNDAVGTTQRVSGTIALDGEGRVAPGSKFTVDLRSLRSDEERRDNYLRERTLTTASFPYAEFVPREIRGLPFPLPGAGRATVQLLGDLTIRGVTRPTTWEGTVEFSGGTVRLQARTAFTFADFALTQPRVMRVLSIEDKIRLEVDLTLRPAS